MEPSPPAIVGASVDLGSNSVHLLVAAVAGHRLQPLADESVFLGLGDAVHDGGPLGAAKRAELVAALGTYADTARRLGATSITFIGTEPLRRAADAARVVHDVVHASGVPLHILSHEEEAYLTLIGVMEGRPVTHETLVVDIGGGSSEFATVGPNRPAAAAGLRLGSALLTSRHVSNDPPTTAEVAAIGRTAREILAGAVTTAPSEIVGVGGTVSNLVKVLPAAIADRTLTRSRIAEIQEILSTEPAALASQRHLVNPIRARLLPAGGAIVDAILERYGVDELRVSEAGIREGAVFAVQHAGPAWRDRLADLARGWRT